MDYHHLANEFSFFRKGRRIDFHDAIRCKTTKRTALCSDVMSP